VGVSGIPGRPRIAWCLTGAGHLLAECLELALSREGTDLFLSRAAEEVLRMYRLEGRLSGRRVLRDRTASSPASGRFAEGTYRCLVIAPATSNSVAKFVLGLSDNLVSTLFAQAGKSRIPTAVLPTDTAPEMESLDPAGRSVRVYPRPLDLELVRRLALLPGVIVLEEPEALDRWIEGLELSR
jgi:flavoprotein